MPDEIDLNFLGEQIRRLQADVRDVKGRMARTDADVLALNEQMVALNERLESLERRVEAGFDESRREFAVLRAEMAGMRSEMSRNLEIVLTAIRELRE